MVFTNAQGATPPLLASFLGDVVEATSPGTPAACVGNGPSAQCTLTTFAPA
jgi:hypothetical protein